MYAASCSPFADHIFDGFNVYIQFVFPAKCSFHIDLRVILVLFNNENSCSLVRLKLTHLEHSDMNEGSFKNI